MLDQGIMTQRRMGSVGFRRDEGRSNRPDRLVVGRRIGSGGRRARRYRCRRSVGTGGGDGALLGRCGRRFCLRPRHFLRPFLGDDDVALLFGGGLVVDGFQRVGPGLAGGFAGAGWVELLPEAEGIRRRAISLAADRHCLVHVLAGIAIGIEVGLGGRTKRLAGLLVVGKTLRHSRKRDREIAAVAGADADGAIGAGRGAGVRRHGAVVIVATEQVIQEIAGAALLLLLLQRVGVLLPVIVLRERHKNRPALVFPLAAAEAGAQALEIRRDLVEVCAHLLNLIVHRTALRILTAEQREEAGALAAHPLRLQRDAVQLRLLPGGRILVAANLFVLGRVTAAAAAVDRRQLGLEPRAHRIGGRALRRGGA